MTDKPAMRRKPIKPRSTRRVEDSEKATSVVKSSAHRGTTLIAVPIGTNGLPMIEIMGQASELVPVAQYANVTIGPVAVRRWVEDTGDDEELHERISDVQALVMDIIAEDREAVEESVRLHNQRTAEEEAKEAKKRR